MLPYYCHYVPTEKNLQFLLQTICMQCFSTIAYLTEPIFSFWMVHEIRLSNDMIFIVLSAWCMKSRRGMHVNYHRNRQESDGPVFRKFLRGSSFHPRTLQSIFYRNFFLLSWCYCTPKNGREYDRALWMDITVSAKTTSRGLRLRRVEYFFEYILSD